MFLDNMLEEKSNISSAINVTQYLFHDNKVIYLIWNSLEYKYGNCRSQWPRGGRHSSAAAFLVRFRVRMPKGARMFDMRFKLEVFATSRSFAQRKPTN